MLTIALIVFSAALRLDKLDQDVSRFSRNNPKKSSKSQTCYALARLHVYSITFESVGVTILKMLGLEFTCFFFTSFNEIPPCGQTFHRTRSRIPAT